MVGRVRADGRRRAHRPASGRTSARAGERGAAALEFALVTPILFILVFGIIGYGIVFAQSLTLGNASRDGARTAVVQGRTCAQVFTAARNSANTLGMSASRVSVTVKRGLSSSGASTVCPGASATQPCAAAPTGSAVFVTVSFLSRPPVPVPGWGSSRTLSATSSFLCEIS